MMKDEQQRGAFVQDHGRTRKFHFYKEQKHYYFDIEIITDLGSADSLRKSHVKTEVKEFFIRHWKDFGDEFFNHSLFDSKWILLVRKRGNLVGVATVHKIMLEGKVFYNFKTDGVAPEYQSIGLLGRMSQILFAYAYWDNLFVQKSFSIELIFTTPNLRILGLFSKNSTHIYPNPYLFDRTRRSIPLPDEKVWSYVQAYNKIDFPANLPLSKEACVVEDSESQWPYLCYERSGFPYYKEDIVNAFGDHYLQYKEGKKRMFVVYAHITIVDVIRYFTKAIIRILKDAFSMFRP